MNKTDLPEGREVWLAPGTKTAPSICYRNPAAVIINTDRWPMVRVEVKGEGKLSLHYLNIRLRPVKGIQKDRERGDTAQGRDEGGSQRRSAAYRPHKPIEMPEGMEEQPLW